MYQPCRLFPLFTSFIALIVMTLPASGQVNELDSLELVLKGPLKAHESIAIHLKLSEGYRKTGATEPAELHANEAIRLNKKAKTTETAAAYKQLGIIYWMLGANDTALHFFDLAREIYTIQNEELELARLLNNYGLVYLRSSELPKAVEYFLKAIPLLQKLGDDLSLSQVYNNLAAAYQRLRYYRQGLDICALSLTLKEKLGDTGGLANTYNNMGNMYYSQSISDSALYFFRKSLNLKQTLNDLPRIAKTLGNIANIFTDVKQFDSALHYQLQSLSIRRNLGDPYGIAVNKNGLGNLLAEMGRLDEALRYLEEAGAELETLGDPQELAQSHFFRADLYERKGEFDQALHHFRIFQKLNDSLISEANFREVGRLEAQSAFRIKEVQLEREKTIEQSKKARFRYLFIIALLLCALAIGIALFIYKGRQYARQLNAILQRKNSIISRNHNLIREESNQLENKNELKNKVFSMLSHDMKSPLFQIRQLLELQEEGELSAEEYETFKIDLSQKLDNTIEMTDNILTWASRLIKGETLIHEPINGQEIIAKTLGILGAPIERKKLKINLEIHQEQDWHSDREMITFLLRNFLHNAIKFTPENGTIHIRFHSTKEGKWLEVEDTGIGMTKMQCDHLFTIQSRSTPGTNKEQGTGIGLIMCKELAELAGGSIVVRSQQGNGTSFKVQF